MVQPTIPGIAVAGHFRIVGKYETFDTTYLCVVSLFFLLAAGKPGRRACESLTVLAMGYRDLTVRHTNPWMNSGQIHGNTTKI